MLFPIDDGGWLVGAFCRSRSSCRCRLLDFDGSGRNVVVGFGLFSIFYLCLVELGACLPLIRLGLEGEWDSVGSSRLSTTILKEGGRAISCHAFPRRRDRS